MRARGAIGLGHAGIALRAKHEDAAIARGVDQLDQRLDDGGTLAAEDAAVEDRRVDVQLRGRRGGPDAVDPQRQQPVQPGLADARSRRRAAASSRASRRPRKTPAATPGSNTRASRPSGFAHPSRCAAEKNSTVGRCASSAARASGASSSAGSPEHHRIRFAAGTKSSRRGRRAPPARRNPRGARSRTAPTSRRRRRAHRWCG